uniref:DUF148 domain-containing protein n=1 Tax=Rhabditophanes sp. KR3021 TaxID=114890 RepID=A0AC35TI81_9BILA
MKLCAIIWILTTCLILGASGWSFGNALGELGNTTSRVFKEFKNTSSVVAQNIGNELEKGAQTVKTKAVELKSTISRIGSKDNGTQELTAIPIVNITTH